MTDEENGSFLSYFSKENEPIYMKCPDCGKSLESSETHQFLCTVIPPKVYIKCKNCSYEGWFEVKK